MRGLLRFNPSNVQYIIWPYHVQKYVSCFVQLLMSLKHFVYSNHFCLAVISLPTKPDGASVVYTFDSFQAAMDENVRHVFALLLMQSLCDDNHATYTYEPATVEEFMATRMRFVRVKVHSV